MAVTTDIDEGGGQGDRASVVVAAGADPLKVSANDCAYNEETRQVQQLSVQNAQILESYTRVMTNFVISLTFIFLFFQFILLVRNDVKHKIRSEMIERLREIKKCKKAYEDNGCSPDIMVPALNDLCHEWFECMTQNPENLDLHHSGKLWAQTLAEMLNSFVETISLRTLIVIVVATYSIVVMTNAVLRFYRVYQL